MAELTESTIALSNFPSVNDLDSEFILPRPEYATIAKQYNNSIARVWTNLDENSAKQRSLIELNDIELIKNRKLSNKLDDSQALLSQAQGSLEKYEEVLKIRNRSK